MRDVTFLANLGGELNPLDGIISYRCANGHVFLLLESVRLEPVGRTSKSFHFSGSRLQVTS